MTIAALINRPCVLLRRQDTGTIDDDGMPVTTTTEVATVCELQQVQRSEPPGLDETSSTLWAVFLPAGTQLTTADAIEVEGQVFELVGEPWAVRNPRTGAESHVEATCKRVGGA